MTDSGGFDLLCKLIATKFFFLPESAGGNSLDTFYIPYQENANNDENSRFSDEDGVCSAVGLSQLGSRAGPGGAFHGHGEFFFMFGSFCQDAILDIDARDSRAFYFDQMKSVSE